jgi:hypothetical protein
MKANCQKDPNQRRMDAQLRLYVNRDPELRYLEELKQAAEPRRRRQIYLHQDRRYQFIEQVIEYTARALLTTTTVVALLVMLFCLS